MPASRVAPNSFRFLEWGHLTSEPGSLVRDARGGPVFTGSRVRRRSDAQEVVGCVARLVDTRIVEVIWDDRRAPVRSLAEGLLVVEALPSVP